MPRDMRRTATVVLFAVWAILGLAGVVGLAVLGYTVVRDAHGEPMIDFTLGKTSEWESKPFRVWGAAQYTVYLMTVNKRREALGAPFRGEIAVEVIDTRGHYHLQETFGHGGIGHQKREGVEWTALRELSLVGRPLRTWQLRARVLEADPSFKEAYSEVRLRRHPPPSEQRGLMKNQVFVPTAIALGLCWVLGLLIMARGDGQFPFSFSTAMLLAGALVLAW